MNVLLVRGDGIGDALACAPLVAALRDAEHGVGALLSTHNRQAYAARAFERVHVLERIPWPAHGSTPVTRRTALAELRAARYDVALVASEEMEAYEIAREAGIPRRIGFTNGWQKPFKSLAVRRMLTRALVRPADAKAANEHEVQTLFRLGDGLHGEARPTHDVARLRPLVLDAPVSEHGCVALQVSRKFNGRGLDEAAYVALARELRGRGAFPLLLGDDAALVTRIGAAAGVPAALRLDTRTWKERLAGSRAVVTPDSGAAHVAGLVGIPCVDLFESNATAALDVARWRPWVGPARTRVLDVTMSPGVFAREVADDVAALVVRSAAAG